MGRYVKSHSNYLLKTKHQEISDGIIYERDITTIGGRDHFAKGQIPIYKSGNFVITVNNDDTAYKKIPSNEWKGNDEGDVWTLDILKKYEKDEKSSYDRKIVLKKDYYDLRDFAYFGSCSELIRTSINDIIDKYPGELFTPLINVWVSKDGTKFYSEEAAKSYSEDYTASVESISVVYTDTKNTENGTPVIRNFKLPNGVDDGEKAVLFSIDNPFGINIYSDRVPEGENPLKYFADGGINNYNVYTKGADGEWDFDHPLDIDFKGFTKYSDADIYCPGDYMGYVEIWFGEISVDYEINKDEKCGKVAAKFTSKGDDTCCRGRIYIFMGDNNEAKYFFDPIYDEGKYYCLTNLRIRPKDEIIEEYYDNLSTFEKILLDRSADYNATFEIIKESDYGYYVETKRYKFPTTYGDYNLGSKSNSFSEYLENLVKIGEYYDERFTDNLWRSMTHEAIKNFDWTYTRHFNPGDESEYIEGGSKIQKIIRIYGREFDETRSYIDAISDNNTITYDNINNLPDYFFSDKLEDDGWDVKLVNPFKLTEYVNGEEVIIPSSIKKTAELKNYYNGKLERIFNEDYGVTNIKPYSKNNITSLRKSKCAEDNAIDAGFENSNCFCYAESLSDVISVKTGESQMDGYHDDCCHNIKIYSSEKEYTSSDVNSEFFKRFILNSKEILRHKGTKEGIEMVLGLFGLKSRDYVYSNDSYFRVETDENGQKLVLSDFGKKYYRKVDLGSNEAFDYEIKEYTMFTPRIVDEYDTDKQMYYIDWINSLKLTTYNTPEYRSGRYISYQGLPVAYRNGYGSQRYIYPSFQNYLPYDGELYYQMNGGWLSKSPFMYDSKNNIIPAYYASEERGTKLFTETVKNVKCVQTLDELLSNRSLATNNGDICQVVDLSGRYAIVDGIVYNLLNEEGFSFFYASIVNNAMTVGNAYFTDFVYISNPFVEDGKIKINLNDDSYNGKSVKIYVVNNDIDVHSNSSSISTFTIFENGKYMEGDNFTNYFRINNPDFSNELSVLGWQQLRDDEYEYYLMDSVNDYSDGNNPHNGHMNYDNGHEYVNRFAHLFKPIYENGLFDTSSINEDIDIYEEARNINDGNGGFVNLVSPDECYKNYDQYLYEDDKCHFFGDLLDSDGNKHEYTLDNFSSLDSSSYRKIQLGLGDIKKYHYGFHNCDEITSIPTNYDGVTNQIVNTKRVEIVFYLNSEDEYSNEWLEEIKYIDSVILPYLTQVIPSNIIMSVNYKRKIDKVCDECKQFKDCYVNGESVINCEGRVKFNIEER